MGLDQKARVGRFNSDDERESVRLGFRLPNYPCADQALVEARRGIEVSDFPTPADREVAKNFDVDAAIKEAEQVWAALEGVQDETDTAE